METSQLTPRVLKYRRKMKVKMRGEGKREMEEKGGGEGEEMKGFQISG